MSAKLAALALVVALAGTACAATVRLETETLTAPTAGPTPDGEAMPAGTPTGDEGVTPTAEPTEAPASTVSPAVEATASIEVSYTEVDQVGETSRGRLVVSDNGSWRHERRGVVSVFDANTREQVDSFADEDGEPIAFATVDLGLGGPDPWGRYWLPGAEHRDGVWMRADRGEATAVERLGREAWQFDTALVPNAIGGGPDQVTVIIDAETGVVLFYDATVAGAPWARVEATEVVVAGPADPGTFTMTDVEIEPDPFSAGFELTTLDQVEAAVGYAPMTPTILPGGYVLGRVAVAPGVTDGATGVEASNPNNSDVVQLEYTNGWRRFVVTTRRATEAAYPWVDPFSGEGTFYESTTTLIGAGAFAGVLAEMSTSPETQPHLWADGRGFVLTIDGPLDEAQMITIANSIEPR